MPQLVGNNDFKRRPGPKSRVAFPLTRFRPWTWRRYTYPAVAEIRATFPFFTPAFAKMGLKRRVGPKSRAGFPLTRFRPRTGRRYTNPAVAQICAASPFFTPVFVKMALKRRPGPKSRTGFPLTRFRPRTGRRYTTHIRPFCRPKPHRGPAFYRNSADSRFAEISKSEKIPRKGIGRPAVPVSRRPWLRKWGRKSGP